MEDKWAACKTGRYGLVSSYFPHFGEEDCLRGWRGSGTIFFGPQDGKGKPSASNEGSDSV